MVLFKEILFVKECEMNFMVLFYIPFIKEFEFQKENVCQKYFKSP